MIKKYFISKDATISNAYEPNLIYRATGSNMGLSDTLQIFSIYGQASSSSLEKARILLFAETDDIATDRTSGIIPASGSCNFYINMFNAEHPFTVPSDFILCLSVISGTSWLEGTGIDDDEYSDVGVVNWGMASTGSTGASYWVYSGSDFHTGTYVPGINLPPTYTQSFVSGLENLRIDITSVVEEMMAGNVENYGFCLYLTSSDENASHSHYVKKFFARGSEYFFYRPTITAEWDESVRDDRGFFYSSSSLADSSDNTNIIYLYNRPRGRLKTIPSITSSNIYVRLWSDRASGSFLNNVPITGGFVSTGIYSASVSLNTSLSTVYDRWYAGGLSTCFYTGSISVRNFSNQGDNSEPSYVLSMPGLKPSYFVNEKPRLKVFVANKSRNMNIYTVANSEVGFEPIKDLYYKVTRVVDGLIVQDYGTGSIKSSRLSYDVSGSYFDYNMSNLQEDFMYRFNFIQKRQDDVSYFQFPESFKFRVDRQKY